jgi:hypothetical protein
MGFVCQEHCIESRINLHFVGPNIAELVYHCNRIHGGWRLIYRIGEDKPTYQITNKLS